MMSQRQTTPVRTTGRLLIALLLGLGISLAVFMMPASSNDRRRLLGKMSEADAIKLIRQEVQNTQYGCLNYWFDVLTSFIEIKWLNDKYNAELFEAYQLYPAGSKAKETLIKIAEQDPRWFTNAYRTVLQRQIDALQRKMDSHMNQTLPHPLNDVWVDFAGVMQQDKMNLGILEGLAKKRWRYTSKCAIQLIQKAITLHKRSMTGWEKMKTIIERRCTELERVTQALEDKKASRKTPLSDIQQEIESLESSKQATKKLDASEEGIDQNVLEQLNSLNDNIENKNIYSVYHDGDRRADTDTDDYRFHYDANGLALSEIYYDGGRKVKMNYITDAKVSASDALDLTIKHERNIRLCFIEENPRLAQNMRKTMESLIQTKPAPATPILGLLAATGSRESL